MTWRDMDGRTSEMVAGWRVPGGSKESEVEMRGDEMGRKERWAEADMTQVVSV